MGGVRGGGGGGRGAMHDVALNVYDLPLEGVPALNPCSYWCGFGVFHSGVEVHGLEFCYGGHPEDSSGVFTLPPRSGYQGAVLRRRHLLGATTASRAQVEALAAQMGRGKYRGRLYHLLTRNCNHFTDDLLQSLLGIAAPAYVNRLAGMAITCSPCLPRALTDTVEPCDAYAMRAGDEEDGVEDDLAIGEALRAAGGSSERQRLLGAPPAQGGMMRS